MQLDDYANAYLFHCGKATDWLRIARAAKAADRPDLEEPASAAQIAHDLAAQTWFDYGRQRFSDDVFNARCNTLDAGSLCGQMSLDEAVAGLAKRVTPDGV